MEGLYMMFYYAIIFFCFNFFGSNFLALKIIEPITLPKDSDLVCRYATKADIPAIKLMLHTFQNVPKPLDLLPFKNWTSFQAAIEERVVYVAMSLDKQCLGYKVFFPTVSLPSLVLDRFSTFDSSQGVDRVKVFFREKSITLFDRVQGVQELTLSSNQLPIFYLGLSSFCPELLKDNFHLSLFLFTLNSGFSLYRQQLEKVDKIGIEYYLDRDSDYTVSGEGKSQTPFILPFVLQVLGSYCEIKKISLERLFIKMEIGHKDNRPNTFTYGYRNLCIIDKESLG
jgi:hypothetical protein